MARYLVFPKGYDPMVAAGPPSEWFKKKLPEHGWTPEDTKKHLEMEYLSTIEFAKPSERYTCDITSKQYDNKTVAEIIQMARNINS